VAKHACPASVRESPERFGVFSVPVFDRRGGVACVVGLLSVWFWKHAHVLIILRKPEG
jgi:hypothetical protein